MVSSWAASVVLGKQGQYITRRGGKYDRHAARLQAQRRAPSLSQAETDLLLNISQCVILPATQQRCAELTRRQRTQGLVEQEQAELMALVDEIEEVNARRLGYLVDLAHIRQISADELMQRLEIRPITHGRLYAI